MDPVVKPIIRKAFYQADHRVRVVVIAGNDPDAVWSAGLDVKNAAGLRGTPVLSALEPAGVFGWWLCQLTSPVRDVSLQ
ncbi:hypothetical protein [Paraburkholderia dipogonis]|uniref:hypothetical protein n=1 Tax=Paraburkholderia dipogonis TaxID=1211383 RepID=UPI0038B888AB